MTKTKGRVKKPRKTQKDQIKSVIFVPHTTNSELAQEMRKTEETLKNITGDKIKIVEKAGKKLEDLITGKDPWKGQDCGRPNCFLCSTKILTGKEQNKDCTKKNVVYEIVCLTCEDREKEKVENLELDDEKKAELMRNVRKHKYIGETSRSMYDRGFEHLDKLASLNSNSHMLKHIVAEHENEDFQHVKWGMFVRKFVRNSFERQIEEAVSIERERKTCNILNSRSEYNQSCLPRLETRLGDPEQEFKEWEAEVKAEKEKDEKLEKKIRELRKQRNRARLETEITNKNTEKKASKRQKISEDNYITIRNVWGAPAISAPKKNSLEEEEQTQDNSKKTKKRKIENRETEILTNIEVLDNKIIEGEILDMEKYELENIDWDAWLAEHHAELEREAAELEKRRKEQDKKHRSWELYRECKKFLEENEKDWKNRKQERDIENKRKERLNDARIKQDNIREKVRERNLDKKILEKMNELPKREKERIILEENKQKRLELSETCKNLWKLRSKEKKYQSKSDKIKRIERMSEKSEKLELIEKVITELREEEIKHQQEIKTRKERIEKEKIKKQEQKLQRENEKKTRIKKQEMLGERWAMLKWITKFIKENQENWDRENKEREKNEQEKIEIWNKMKRQEKIQELKRKWSDKKTNQLNTETQKQAQTSEITTNNWDVWRPKKEQEKENKNTTNRETQEKEKLPDKTISYDINKIMKKTKITELMAQKQTSPSPPKLHQNPENSQYPSHPNPPLPPNIPPARNRQEEGQDNDKNKRKKLSLKPPTIEDNPRQSQKKRQRKLKDDNSTPKINTFFKFLKFLKIRK